MAVMDPRKLAFKEYYCNPESETFANAHRSGIKAGFSDEYSKTITAQGLDWVSEIIKDQKLIQSAERVLKNIVDMSTQNVIEIDGEVYLKVDPALLKIQQDTAKFVSETLNKRKYSKRLEVGGINGKDLIPSQEDKGKVDDLIDSIV